MTKPKKYKGVFSPDPEEDRKARGRTISALAPIGKMDQAIIESSIGDVFFRKQVRRYLYDTLTECAYPEKVEGGS